MNPEQNFKEQENEVVEQKKSVLHTVTPLSKYLAMVLFIAMPFIGGWIGYKYAPEKIVEVDKVVFKEVEVEVIKYENETDVEDLSEISLKNPVRDGAYTTYDVEGGVITGEWYADYGPNVHGGSSFYFKPDELYRGIIPKIFDGLIFRFLILENGLSSQDLFDLNLQELEKEGNDCTVGGGKATILISKYNVLEAEIGASDSAELVGILSFTPHDMVDCR